MLAYRRADEPDAVFIVGSWLDSFRSAHSAGLIAMADWRSVMEPQVRRVLARSQVETIVACHPDEETGLADLYGWIAVERGHDLPLVHYCYVKSSYRKEGIARGLFKAAGIDPGKPFLYTCKTYVIAELRRRSLIPAASWAPLIARRPEEQHQRTHDRSVLSRNQHESVEGKEAAGKKAATGKAAAAPAKRGQAHADPGRGDSL